mmetsp:Transcript_58058/g.92219  ORF Transcript_58058/g.92219 Transcript_58058/m.92219 type:complete len:575 (+) Transcript_58058:134-1858(+)|eukprot:CAMPEP_0197046160 /NCGR_PEP_ID=MMETSP1384-20130603/21905_1 /TAXON_ID=29189 /ORGANISM="Ammonia sp." /LENGTH=574 /DNA_ID=CAMNT_0042477893 /DNA_START=128 /DNA_END=1852 /DNA_ORIENTATION=-
MSTRYYGAYYNQAAYNRPRPQKQSAAYANQASSPKQTKAKQRSRGIPDSGRIPGPYTPTLGRKKPVGHWKAKKKSDATLKGGEFNHETVEEELNKYKRGVFYFDDANAAANAAANGHAAKQSQHKRYAQHQLLKTQDAPPKVYEAVDELPPPVPPDYEERTKSGPAGDDDDEKEFRQSKEARPRSEEETKQKPSSHGERSKKQSTTTAASKSSKSRKKKTTRIQPMVTVSPSRTAAGAYGATQVPPEYYYGYGGYDAHAAGVPTTAPPPPSYYGYGRDDMYRPSLPSYGRSNYVPDGYAYLGPRGVAAPYNQFAKGYVQDDGTWYPYDILANDPYSTPKTKRTRKEADSANVDLTTPIADGERDKKMSPGRRVNKIQKQLEYYFSPQNMETDLFLRSSMDKEGWIDIAVILGFKRMKYLQATKELVVEAAFHSNVVEVDSKTQDKIRMTELWKQYVNDVNGRKEKRRSKKKSSSEQRKKEKEEERKLDEAELNKQTYEQIAALIEHKMERRRKRHEERERMKKEQEKEANKDADEKGDDDNDEEEAVKELILKDQQQPDDSQGDPDGNDMVEID